MDFAYADDNTAGLKTLQPALKILKHNVACNTLLFYQCQFADTADIISKT